MDGPATALRSIVGATLVVALLAGPTLLGSPSHFAFLPTFANIVPYGPPVSHISFKLQSQLSTPSLQ
jgi:hypothetical protein